MWKTGGILAFAGMLAVLLTGCALESPLSIRRVWMDHNTLKTPALYYDKITHLPPDSVRVKEMRWMYNQGPHEIGAFSLLPEPQSQTPVQGPPSLIHDRSPMNTSPQVPLPKTPSGEKSNTAPIPPLPSKSQIPKSRGIDNGPVAERNTPALRTARPGGTWRFIH